MATIEELKDMIVELRMDLVRANIPYTDCPYAYYSTSKQSDRSCEDISCNECKAKFMRDMREDIEIEVAAL